MGGTPEGAIKRLENMRKNGTDKFNEYGALGGAMSKGRKLSKKTKLKISQTKKRRQRENKQISAR